MKKESELRPDELKTIGEMHARIEKHEQDPVVKTLRKKFIKAAFLLTADDQALFARLYAKHIAGVEIPEDWWKWENPHDIRQRLDQIGRRLNSSDEQPPRNGKGLWEAIHRTFPGLFSEDEKEWLIRKDPSGDGGLVLLCDIQYNNCCSSLVSEIGTYIHAWK